MAIRIFFLWVVLFNGLVAFAQNKLQITITNAYTGEPVAGAIITVENPISQLRADSDGRFEIEVGPETEILTLAVNALGTSIRYEVFPQSARLLELRLAPKGLSFETATLHGLTARQVVQKAIQRIFENYPDSSYVYYGFYRQYQQSGTYFQNLVEAQVAVAILPKKEKNKLAADLLFAILNSKKQALTRTQIEDVDIREGLSEQLFEEDPVYFISHSSFVGRLLDVSRFRFDSVYSGPDEYRIHYTSALSSEDHGFGQKFATQSVYLESYETGTLEIDRKTFAFKRIRRHARRLPGFDYYNMPNWVRPSRLLSRELVDGQLDVQYVQRGNRWFLTQISHGYFNDYYSHNVFMRPQKRLGEFFEWQTQDISSEVPKRLVKDFTPKPYVQFLPEIESGFVVSQKPFPFLFFPEETVRNALLSSGK